MAFLRNKIDVLCHLYSLIHVSLVLQGFDGLAKESSE